MSADGWRRVGWLLPPILAVVAYLALREYADRARSLEAVLGLVHGDPLWHALVAGLVILLRVAAYALVGGTLVAWPIDAWLRWRATASGTPPTSSP
jgi:hypothetical protein